jgi:hypothetical protein
MGRVIIFQSEKVEHEVRPNKGYQRFAVTSWYRHTHRVEERKVQLIERSEETIFIGIPAYRDPELPQTVLNIIETADRPDLLHFGICFQYDLEDKSEEEESDFRINLELDKICEKYSSICKFSVDKISYQDARNAYYARHRV